MELGLEGHAHVGRGLVGEEGGVARHPGGEAGLVKGDALLADGAPPTMGAETEESITRLGLANESRVLGHVIIIVQ